MNKRFHFTCNENLNKILKKLAKDERKSISLIVVELILEALEWRDDLYLSQLAEQAEKSSKGKKTISHKDVWNNIDSL